MRPRGEVTVIDVNTPVNDIIQLFAQTGYSRMPVYRDQRDNIIGVLYSKDLLPWLHRPEEIHIENLLRTPLFVPDAVSVGEVLRQMLHAKKQFSIVVDEYGAFEGILSLEDLLEELVGEIRDEHDVEEETDILRQTDSAWIVDGLLTVREVNRRLQLNIPESDEYATVAGFLMTITGKLPVVGEKISHQDLSFTIQQIKGRRIDRVRIEIPSRAST
jgi:CBS domain containing-hemolysin-like protein